MTSADFSVEPAVERRLQLDNVEARYLEAGDGIPTICIHGVGYTNGADSWLPSIRAGLADGLHIYAIDQIGWGMGSRMDFEYSISYLADHIREIQDKLGYSRTNIIGHSLGGWIAATFAYESPNRVRKLVLDSIAGMNPTPAGLGLELPGAGRGRGEGLGEEPVPLARPGTAGRLLLEERPAARGRSGLPADHETPERPGHASPLLPQAETEQDPGAYAGDLGRPGASAVPADGRAGDRGDGAGRRVEGDTRRPATSRCKAGLRSSSSLPARS